MGCTLSARGPGGAHVVLIASPIGRNVEDDGLHVRRGVLAADEIFRCFLAARRCGEISMFCCLGRMLGCVVPIASIFDLLLRAYMSTFVSTTDVGRLVGNDCGNLDGQTQRRIQSSHGDVDIKYRDSLLGLVY